VIKKYSLLQRYAGATQQQIDSVATKLNLTPEQVVSLANAVDPTPEKKFEAWILKQMGFKNIILPEDGNRVQQVLQDFITLSNKKQLQKRDIQQYRRIHDLEAEIDKIKGLEATPETSEKLNEYLQLPGVEIFLQIPGWLVLSVKNPHSAAELASGTKWCTSDPETADYYIAGYFLLVFFEKTGTSLKKMYQATLSFDQFMDVTDDPVTEIESDLAQAIVDKYFTILEKDPDDDTLYSSIYETIRQFLFMEAPLNEETIQFAVDSTPNGDEVWENIYRTGIHDFREKLIESEATPQEFMYLFNSYTEIEWEIPRWKEFEKAVEREQFDFDLQSEDTVYTILSYLAGVEKFGRWETVDNYLLDAKFVANPDHFGIWFHKMIKYLKFNDAPDIERWAEFETFIQKLMQKAEKLTPPDIFAWRISLLAATYWRYFAPKYTRWNDEVEDFILKFGDSYGHNFYYQDNPWQIYKYHAWK
jgi:hypothetical protein